MNSRYLTYEAQCVVERRDKQELLLCGMAGLNSVHLQNQYMIHVINHLTESKMHYLDVFIIDQLPIPCINGEQKYVTVLE